MEPTSAASLAVSAVETTKKITTALAELIAAPIPAVKEKFLHKSRQQGRKTALKTDLDIITEIQNSSLSAPAKELLLRRALESPTEFSLAARQEENIRAIAQEACRIVPGSYTEDSPDRDLLMHALDSCKNVSDPEVRTIWAQLLAEEISSPHQFSKASIGKLRDFDKGSVLVLKELAGYAVTDGANCVILLFPDHFGSREVGHALWQIGLELGTYLKAIEQGLLGPHDVLQLNFENEEKSATFTFVSQGNSQLKLSVTPAAAAAGRTLTINVLKFTQTAAELLNLPEVPPNPEYLKSLQKAFEGSFIAIDVLPKSS